MLSKRFHWICVETSPGGLIEPVNAVVKLSGHWWPKIRRAHNLVLTKFGPLWDGLTRTGTWRSPKPMDLNRTTAQGLGRPDWSVRLQYFAR